MISILLNHPHAELVAVCDKYEPLLMKAKEAAEKAGLSITCYKTFDEFIQHDMDAVVLANYANEHAPYAIRCMKAGMHVLSEVLPCETMAQAVELIGGSRKRAWFMPTLELLLHEARLEMWQGIKRRYRRGHVRRGEYIHDCSSIWHALHTVREITGATACTQTFTAHTVSVPCSPQRTRTVR